VDGHRSCTKFRRYSLWKIEGGRTEVLVRAKTADPAVTI
jgi:hypothetical protein